MRKTIKFLSLFLVLATLLVGCGQKSEESKHLNDIDYATLKEKIENEDDFILEIVQTGCSNCTAFSPKFESVLEENEIVAYSLNISNMSDEDKDEFLDNYNVSGTPTVIFFEDGKETSTLKRLTGNQSKEKIISKLKANGYIEE